MLPLETKNTQKDENGRFVFCLLIYSSVVSGTVYAPYHRLAVFDFQSDHNGLSDPKEIKYNLHYGEVRGRSLTTAIRHLTLAAIKYNKNLKGCFWKQRIHIRMRRFMAATWQKSSVLSKMVVR